MKTVDQLLAEARAGLRRLSPAEAHRAMGDGAHLAWQADGLPVERG